MKLKAAIEQVVKEEVYKRKISVLKEEATDVKPMHVLAADITKMASNGLKSIESLKKKEFPTAKSNHAVSSALEGLEVLYNDMLHSPMSYLDVDPDKLVNDYREKLSAEDDSEIK